MKNHFNNDSWKAFTNLPTIFYYIEPSDSNYKFLCILGITFSFISIVSSAGLVAPVYFILWAIYTSIVNVGQEWYSFGWESQLLETGFIAIFMSPLFNFNSSLFNPRSKTPRLVLIVARWMICRLMLGAGLIKIRGDQCWRDLTCMKYHYETQPVPNPISPFLHFNPVPYVH